MRPVQIIFRAAGIYGLVITLPQYFRLEANGAQFPPAITHPEYYFGFLGTVAVFQILFLTIANDPMHYRALMPLCVLEKLVYADPAAILYSQHRLASPIFLTGVIDAIWGLLFAWAFYTTTRAHRAAAARRQAFVCRQIDRIGAGNNLQRQSVRQ